MICCEDGEEYQPYGKAIILRHPTCENRKKKYREWWLTEERNGLEEELYFYNRSVVWTRGRSNAVKLNASDAVDCEGCGDTLWKSKKEPDDYSRQIICSLTVDTPIKQALFTTFYSYPDLPAMLGDPIPDRPTGTAMFSLCVLEQEFLTMHTEGGDEYSIPLPFAVESIWSTRYGLLLQRKIKGPEPEPPNPLLFSLLHPLDDISPVNQKTCSSNALLPSYSNDIKQCVLMSSLSPSIILTHSSKNNSVSVWKTRRCNMEENEAMVNNCSFADGGIPPAPLTKVHNSSLSSNIPLMNFSQHHRQSRSSTYRFTPSGIPNPPPSMLNENISHIDLNLTSNTTINFTTPKCDKSAVVGNSAAGLSRLASPALTPNVTTWKLPAVKTPVNNRLRSVMTAGGDRLTPRQQSSLSLFGQSPQLPLKLYPVSTPSRTPRSTISKIPVPAALNETRDEIKMEPIIPNLCLELLWTDQTATKPKKVFLSEDFVGQKFLCLLFDDFMRLIKYEATNDFGNLVFGSCSTINARDCSPLPGLSMIVTVDPMGGLELYSGISLICKANVTQVTHNVNSSLFKDFSCLNISCKLPTDSIPNPSTPLRRSSLMSANKAVPDLKFDVMFSPVVIPKETERFNYLTDDKMVTGGHIKTIGDPTYSSVTVESDLGVMHRINLPRLWSSSIVSRMLTALKFVLPKDVALSFITKWYAARNSPGSVDFSSNNEWFLFSRLLLTMVGYDTNKLQEACPADSPDNAGVVTASKKAKMMDSGSDQDWDYVLSSGYHMENNSSISDTLYLGWTGSIIDKVTDTEECNFNTSAPLFPHIYGVFYALHLLYEELKCCTLYWDVCALLVPCISQLASDIRLTLYLHYYWKDFPILCSPTGPNKHISNDQLLTIVRPHYFSETPPNFQLAVMKIMKGEEINPFPYIPEVCPLTKNILLIYYVAANDTPLHDVPVGKCLQCINPFGYKTVETVKAIPSISQENNNLKIHEKIVLLIDSLGLNSLDVQLITPGLSLLFMNSQHFSRVEPPSDWIGPSYRLIKRPDMVKHLQYSSIFSEFVKSTSKDAFSPSPIYDGFRLRYFKTDADKSEDKAQDAIKDGMNGLNWGLMSLRWPLDKRINDVRNMLDSATPIYIDIPPPSQGIELSDTDITEEQNRLLLTLSLRTMALPVGRGMFTLFSKAPLVTDTINIPSLTLSGKSALKGNIFELTNIELPPNMNVWPLFHNGVAAALRIQPNCTGLESSWIQYNQPKEEDDAIIEHGGFLLGLGLSGHLHNLSSIAIHNFLSRSSEMTTVGLLLGLAISRRGTCHFPTTKLLSIHLECLLPPTCIELDIHHSVQVASIMGIGLLYQGSGHRHMAEVLLREIGRPPGPEMENSSDRESYSLAAGLGLGLVMLGKGSNHDQFSDMNIAGQLYHYIKGGYQKPMTGPTREKYKSPSYQIKEGKRVNIDITSPGATLALGLIYFGSGNAAIAEWMVAPPTPYLLDQIRPDFLLLRMISYGLIMWDEVMPTCEWVEKTIPPVVQGHVSNYNEQALEDLTIDYETMYQSYLNILTGSCFVLSLKFAGSANAAAFDVVHKYFALIYKLSRSNSVTVVAGRFIIESCLCTMLLSMSLIMAGTGDLEVLRIIRLLRERAGTPNVTITYGSHTAIHMALGFLFLGGGRLTLSADRHSVAALLISCFPKMPYHSADNRYHLQAFRHLYVLACEPRLLVPVDVDSNTLCRAKVSIKFAANEYHDSFSYQDTAPVMLPQLSLLQEVVIEPQTDTDRYWPVRFVGGSNMDILESLLMSGVGVPMKLRAGEAPYPVLVPSGDTLSTLLPPDKLSAKGRCPALSWIIQDVKLSGIDGNEAYGLLKYLVGVDISDKDCQEKRLLLSERTCQEKPLLLDSPDESPPEEEDDPIKDKVLLQLMLSILSDALATGKPEIVPSWITVIQGVRQIISSHHMSGMLVWQVKLFHSIADFMLRITRRDALNQQIAMETNDSPIVALPRQLVSPDQSISLLSRLHRVVDEWSRDVSSELLSYLSARDCPYTAKAALTLLLKELPHPSLLPNGCSRRLALARELHSHGVLPEVIQAVISHKNT